MKALALVVLLALPALAQDVPVPADAPAIEQPLCLKPDDAKLLAQRVARLDAENASLKASAGPPWWVPVVVGVVALGVGFGVGYGVHAATAK